MATLAKQIFCFFLIILSSTCCQTQARESKFFSKYVHLVSTNSYVTIPSTHPKVVPLSSPSPSPAPITSQISGVPVSGPIGANSDSTPAPAPTTLGSDYSPAPAPAALGAGYSPVPAPSENDIPYYGLYARDNDIEEEEFGTENPEVMNNRESSYTYSNGYSNSLSNNNGFWTSNQKGYQNTNNVNDYGGGYKSQPEGMSDTRGKYYDNVEHQNYNPSGYENNNEEGYYNDSFKKSKYEFDSMEEYEKEEGYGDVQQEFIP